jgi:hypothetical protein
VKGKAWIEKEPIGKGSRVLVTFELPSALWADRVNVVGEFNDWDTTATPMTRDRAHAGWRVTVGLPAGAISFASCWMDKSGSTSGTRMTM